MTRDQDRMSPVLRSMITDDQSLERSDFPSGPQRDQTVVGFNVNHVRSAATCPAAKPEPTKVNHANCSYYEY